MPLDAPLCSRRQIRSHVQILLLPNRRSHCLQHVDACVQARTDRRLLALTPQINVSQADRVVVAQDRVLLLGELCARCTSQSMRVVSTAINGALWHVVRAWQAVGVARRWLTHQLSLAEAHLRRSGARRDRGHRRDGSESSGARDDSEHG